MELSIEKLLKYVSIVKALEDIPQLGFKIQSKYRRIADKELVTEVTKYSELFRQNTSYRVRLVYSLLTGENTEKDKLKSLIAEELEGLSVENMMRMIKSKEDAENLAFSICVLEDYMNYLQTGKWQGPISEFKQKEDLEKLIEIRDIASVADIDFSDTRNRISKDTDTSKKLVQKLTKLDKNTIIKELVLAYSELKTVKETNKRLLSKNIDNKEDEIIDI